MFAYHTDRTGIYAAPGATDPWRLKGWAVTGADGSITDVTVSYPQDLTKQMLEYAEATQETRRAFLMAEQAAR